MSTSTLPLRQEAPALLALRTGTAVAVTVAVFYVLCTLAWIAAPDPFLGFMNNLFHGIDFRPLVQTAGFAWAGFFEALLVLALWAFLAGSFYGWLRQLLDA